MKIYMIVSRDKYELPEVVAESLREMARYTGRSLDSMHTCFSKGRHPERGGHYKYFRRYVTVEIEDDEDYGLENIALIDKKNGMSLITVSKLLGHENIGTTQIYLDVDNRELEEAHRKFVV